MIYRYYTLYRPPMPGTIPRIGLKAIEYFNVRTDIEPGIRAWGFADYNRRLTVEEIAEYELSPSRKNPPEKFEVGKHYEATDPGHVTITILSRTEKTIKVRNEYGYEWRMNIRIDADGNEYTYDSSVGKKWVESFTYRATLES